MQLKPKTASSKYGIKNWDKQELVSLFRKIADDEQVGIDLSKCLKLPVQVCIDLENHPKKESLSTAFSSYAQAYLLLELFQDIDTKPIMVTEDKSAQDVIIDSVMTIQSVLGKETTNQLLRNIRTVIEDAITRQTGKGPTRK